MYWLSFADPNLPEGSQFLGVVVAPLDDFVDAVTWAHAAGVNPGGECKGTGPFDRPDWMTDDMVGALLSKDFIETKMGGAGKF